MRVYTYSFSPFTIYCAVVLCLHLILSKGRLFGSRLTKSKSMHFTSNYVHFPDDSHATNHHSESNPTGLVGLPSSSSFRGGAPSVNKENRKTNRKYSSSMRHLKRITSSYHRRDQSKSKRNGRSKKENGNGNRNRAFIRNAFSSNENSSDSTGDLNESSYHSDPSSNHSHRQHHHHHHHSPHQKHHHLRHHHSLRHRSNRNHHPVHHRRTNLSQHRKYKSSRNTLYSRSSRSGSHHLHRHKSYGSAMSMDGTMEDLDDRKKRKILLLGNGSSGKSTIFKQLKLILGDGRSFDENELLEATCAIRQNCVSVLLGVLHKCTVLFDSDHEHFEDCRFEVVETSSFLVF